MIIQYPHCDSKILHAPGECDYCDAHPDWQRMRIDQMINFTGHHDPGLLPCPAEQVRPLELIERWGGNIPTLEQNPADFADQLEPPRFEERQYIAGTRRIRDFIRRR